MLGNVIHGGIKKISKVLLKRRGLIAAFILPFVFWGAIIVLWFYRAPQSVGSPSMQTSANRLGGASIGDIALSQDVLDDDKDGLSNWEESIYGTSISNPDTDGDKYLDGEEILSGHDPLKKGPNDIYQQKKGALTKQEQETKTATDAFARVALINFFNNKDVQNFSSLTPEQLDSKLKESFKSNPESIQEYQQVMRDSLYDFVPIDLAKKIKILDTSSEKDEQIYMERFKKMMEDASSKTGKYTGHLYEVITDAFEKKDFNQVDDAANTYMFLYETMLKIPAPKSLAEVHRAGLQLFYETSISLKIIKNWENDPAKTIIAIKKLTFWNEKLIKETRNNQQNTPESNKY